MHVNRKAFGNICWARSFSKYFRRWLLTQIMDFSIIAVCKLKGLRVYLRHNEDESCFFVNGSSLLKVMLLKPGFTCHYQAITEKDWGPSCPRTHLERGHIFLRWQEVRWIRRCPRCLSLLKSDSKNFICQWEIQSWGTIVANSKRPVCGQIRLTAKTKGEEGTVACLALHG